MPSVWYEGFGLIAMEAMLRGLPVVASDSGGLAEAKRGTGYVIPVRPVERYEPVFDETHMPRAVAPEQDIGPWEQALRTLLTDEEAYWAEAGRSREAALRFVGKLDAGGLEKLLAGLEPAGQELRGEDKLKALDSQRRALLLARLRKKAQA
jgi:glycosyltransferase involved in cell wall biosynthesis